MEITEEPTKKIGAFTTEEATGTKKNQIRMIPPPVLEVPHVDCHMALDSEECHVQVEYVLLQE